MLFNLVSALDPKNSVIKRLWYMTCATGAICSKWKHSLFEEKTGFKYATFFKGIS